MRRFLQVNTKSDASLRIERVFDKPDKPAMFPLLASPKEGAARVNTKSAPTWLQQHLNGTSQSSLWIRCTKSNLVQLECTSGKWQVYVPVEGDGRREKYIC